MAEKVLVCGATGFMGTNIVRKISLNKNYDIYGVGMKRVSKELENPENSISTDLTIKQNVDTLFKTYRPDIVIQAAANTSGSKDIVERPYLHVTDNALMNANILQACYDYDVKHFIFLSCGVMYNPERSPVKETDFSLDEEIHKNYFGVGWTKVYVEKLCEFYSRLGKTKHTAIRHSNTYGPNDKYDLEKSHMFGATVTKVMQSPENGSISVWGDGSTERDLLYVDDVVDFIETVIEKQEDPYELINVSYGDSFSVKEIVEKIIAASGKNLSIEFDLSKPSINTKLVLNNELAYSKFGWRPSHSIDEGIKKTISWYKDNLG